MRALLRMVVAMAALTATVTANAHAAPPPTCHLGPALFANPYAWPAGTPDRLAVLQTYQRGRYVGYFYDGTNRMDLMSWRDGHRPAVLAHRRFWNVPYGLNSSIVPVGVTPGGAVVANMQDGRHKRRHPYAYAGGREIRMRTLPAWHEIVMLAVTDAGHVLGYGTVGTGDRTRVELAVWRGIRSVPRVVGTVRSNGLGPFADRRGDFVWSSYDDAFRSTVHVRFPDGTVRPLDSGLTAGDDYAALSSSHYLFGSAGNRIVRWDTTRRSTTGDLAPATVVVRYASSGVTAVGASGDFVYGADRRRYAPGDGTSVALPGEYSANGPDGEAIGPHHQVAFTRARDHLVHFLRC